MALEAGTKLGPYEIDAQIGAGGMGEVYRARDTRLDRTVAVKVLPAHLSSNPDLKQRFEREARAISNLSHPNICSLYDIGHQNGIDYLVMEFLEGETLAARLAEGPLPNDQFYRYGMDISAALDIAHKRGIVHRDLKPANVMITKSGAKLLDFGLARYEIAAPKVSEVSSLPTEHKDLTQAGMILGTLQYMAPEQLQGKAIDPRTDIFALGTVLYEMATGKRAFQADSQASLIAAILKEDPKPISQVQPLASPMLDRLVSQCLAKDPEDRWQSAHDVMTQLRWMAEAGSQAAMTAPIAVKVTTPSAKWLAALSTLALVLFAIYHFLQPTAQNPLLKLAIVPPPNTVFGLSIELSPDGKHLAFVADKQDGSSALWLRDLNSFEARMVPGTDGAIYPFWSPDGRSIAFFAQGKLRKMTVEPEQLPQILCDAGDPRGGTWGRDGDIVFAPNAGDGLYRISSAGGAVTKVTSLDATKQQSTHRFPHFLPDGHHFIYLTFGGGDQLNAIFAGSIDSKETKQILSVESLRKAVYAAPGYLIYYRSTLLMANRFDEKKLELIGEPVQIADQVWFSQNIGGLASFSVSENGTLAFRSGGSPNSRLQWVDRSGKLLGTVADPAPWTGPVLSPDGTKAVVGCLTGDTNFDIWSIDSQVGGTASRLTFTSGAQWQPVWSPDGNRIIYASNQSGIYDLYQKPSNGAGAEELLLKTGEWKFPQDWSRDGKFLLFQRDDPKTKSDLWILQMADRKMMPYLVTDFNENQARFSPNEKWVVYVSDESGKNEVYVQPFPSSSGGKWQISTAGGTEPVWSTNGSEIFYLAPNRDLMAVPVSLQSGFVHGSPKALFRAEVVSGAPSGSQEFTVSSDGQRFLINSPIQDVVSSPIHVVTNWPALLKK